MPAQHRMLGTHGAELLAAMDGCLVNGCGDRGCRGRRRKERGSQSLTRRVLEERSGDDDPSTVEESKAKRY